MAKLPGENRAESVRSMFARIAKRYDIANRWMTWGQDTRWRKVVIGLAALPQSGWLLDVGTGTGDLAFEALWHDGSAHAVGADFTLEMMLEGKKRQARKPARNAHPVIGTVLWISANALELPFRSESYDAIVSGYLLRNVTNIEQALLEQYRVLKQGGRIVSLDTTPLPDDIWHLPARTYVRRIIPLIGRIIAGEKTAYEYLPRSTERFLSAEELAHCMEKTGYKDVHYKRLMGSTMAIHWGVKL